ncbi:MAG: GntR family transcriptional regulator [Pseudoclavibacter sp.]
MITLDGSAPPAQELTEQLRGLIESGRLAGGERLPSVRQLATDLGIAPGTVAKVYRALEAEGLLTTRVGSGTRVNPEAAASSPLPVVDAARRFAAASRKAGVDRDEAFRTLRAVWPDDDD